MTQPTRDEMAIADYVLGLLEPAEVAAFERDLYRNPELSQRVARWRQRITELGEAEQETPHLAMRQQIAREFATPGGAGPTAARTSQAVRLLLAAGAGAVVALLAWLAKLWLTGPAG